MTKQITDSERLTIAMLNRKETELKQTKKELNKMIQQLEAMKVYMWELRESNEILSAQVNYLVRKQITHD